MTTSLGLRGDAVGAAAGTGKEMILAFDVPGRPEKVAKDLDLDAAEALAAHCRGTNRAVVFDEQKALIARRFDPRHIAFGRAHIGQRNQLLCDIGLASEALVVGCGDLLPTPREEPRQCRLAEFAAYRADQIDGELGMG